MKTVRLNKEEARKLKSIDFTGKEGFVDSELLLSEIVGSPDTSERKDFDARAMAWLMEMETCSTVI